MLEGKNMKVFFGLSMVFDVALLLLKLPIVLQQNRTH